MKLSLLAALPLLSAVLAAPAPWNDGKPPSKGDDKDKDSSRYSGGSFPFHFTSTAMAWAGPDQVVNNSQVAVPGLPGGYGEFQFGLNSVQNVICYVSHFHRAGLRLIRRGVTADVYSRTSPSISAVTTRRPP